MLAQSAEDNVGDRVHERHSVGEEADQSVSSHELHFRHRSGNQSVNMVVTKSHIMTQVS